MEVCIRKITALRNAANKIAANPSYQWGHMGLCNCGFLAQEITSFSKEEIHSRAMMRSGDWSEQLNDYCPTSGLPMDDLITQLLNFGFTRPELAHLERLSHPVVLGQLRAEKRNLKHNNPGDVITYLKTWAAQLEEEFINSIKLSIDTTHLSQPQHA